MTRSCPVVTHRDGLTIYRLRTTLTAPVSAASLEDVIRLHHVVEIKMMGGKSTGLDLMRGDKAKQSRRSRCQPAPS